MGDLKVVIIYLDLSKFQPLKIDTQSHVDIKVLLMDPQ